MQRIKTVWSGLELRKQVIAVLAFVAILVSVLTISRLATTPSMRLLYAGLEPVAAGEVVRALEQEGAIYEIRGNSIYVQSAQRDQLRMVLAGNGLPMNGGRGYELLDSLNGFGTTSQMFDAAYWRAKEGELARTIVASPHIAQARVHIAHATSNPFQRNSEPKASVSILPAGGQLTPEQANALRYLVASAVARLTTDNVAIIDANGGLLSSGDGKASAQTPDDRSVALRESVLRLVEARVGTGNAVVEVSVETVTETESIKERRFDPESRVAISTETEERTDSSKNQAGGDVTVASNLPDGDAAASQDSSAQASETRERVNYEVSETERELLRVPGAIRRLTVAVLVNAVETVSETGEVSFAPRPETELAALHDLVASAVGFNAERGDVITLKSMQLPTTEVLGTAAKASIFSSLGLDIMALVQVAVLGAVALLLGLFVIRPIFTAPPALPSPDLPAIATSDAPRNMTGEALTGEIDESVAEKGNSLTQTDSLDSIAAARALPVQGDDKIERLRAMIGERREETVEILRGWLEESEENA